MSLIVVTPPATEPLTLTEARAHLRVDYTDEDDLISSLIAAARDYCQVRTNRQFITATYKLSMDQFPFGECIEQYDILIPRPPLVSISSITYLDFGGVTQTVPTNIYRVDTNREPGRASLEFSQSWPGARQLSNSINVQFVAGYGAASTVPEGIKVAMKLLIGHWFANREAVNIGSIATIIPVSVDAILATYSVLEVY
jgi:uncharacterized phiE125 gp8 family phage protein